MDSYVGYRWKTLAQGGVGEERTRRDLPSIRLSEAAKYAVDVGYRGVAVDFSEGLMQFPLDFETTLGVSEKAYAYLAVAGAVLSGLLGSGWIWKILEWLKSQAPKRPTHVPVGRRDRPRR